MFSGSSLLVGASGKLQDYDPQSDLTTRKGLRHRYVRFIRQTLHGRDGKTHLLPAL